MADNIRTEPPEWIKTPDEKTGREVWQITNADGVVSEGVYFEHQAFTADERYIVFRSERGGPSNLWRCDLRTGELAQIAVPDMELRGRRARMHPDGRSILIQGPEQVLYKVDVESFRAEAILSLRGRLPGVPGDGAICADGRRVILTSTEPDKVSKIPGSFGDKSGARMHLGYFDLDDSRFEEVLTWDWGFSHPYPSPVDRDMLTFVSNGDHCWNMDMPQEQRTRTWILNLKTRQVNRLLNPIRYRTITHESWSPDGKRYFFFDKNYREWVPVSICSVNAQGQDWQVHYTSYQFRLGHGVVSPDGRYFISDCQERSHSPLLLIELATGKAEILCWPDATNDGGHDAAAHVHPSFSPTGRYVTYTSDKTGTPQVYVVPL